jgi:hypothetical protein
VIRSLSDSREIELDPAITYAPQWSGDGQHLLGTNREQVVICPVDANPCEVIVDATTDPGGLGSFDGESGPAARFSWDRSRIFYFRHAPVPDMMSLWTVSLDGSDHRHLFDYGPVYELNRRFEVLPDNRILWVRYVKGEAELVLATLSRNASERADPIPADAP